MKWPSSCYSSIERGGGLHSGMRRPKMGLGRELCFRVQVTFWVDGKTESFDAMQAREYR